MHRGMHVTTPIRLVVLQASHFLPWDARESETLAGSVIIGRPKARRVALLQRIAAPEDYWSPPAVVRAPGTLSQHQHQRERGFKSVSRWITVREPGHILKMLAHESTMYNV
jgi:hypothetical protein